MAPAALYNCINNFLFAGNEASHFVIGAIQKETFQILSSNCRLAFLSPFPKSL